MSQTMSNLEQPYSCPSVLGMKIVYSPNVSGLSSGRDAISQHHRTLRHTNKRVCLVGHLVHCNAAVMFGAR